MKDTEQQKNAMLDIIKNNTDIRDIETKLSGKNFSQDATTLLDQHIQENPKLFSSDVKNLVENLYIGQVVKSKDRLLGDADLDGWVAGESSSKLVQKINTNNTDEDNSKYQNIWIQKEAGTLDPSEHICEFVASNMMRTLRWENTPKVRLYNSGGEITIASKFIPNYKSFSKITESEKGNLLRSEEFANFLVSSVMSGNYDLHAENIGQRIDDQGKSHLAQIDHGRGLSYNMKMDFNNINEDGKGTLTPSYDPVSVKDFIAGMDKSIYKDEFFEGLDFATNLYKESSRINRERIEKVVHKSLEVVKENLPSNFLEDQDVENNLREKMGIERSEIISYEAIQEKTMKNISRLEEELRYLAKEKFLEALGDKSLSKAISSYQGENFDLFASYAIHTNDEESKNILREKGANLSPYPWAEQDIDAMDNEGKTKLMRAATDPEKIELLVKLGANLDIQNSEDGYTAIHYATAFNSDEAVEKLINLGADLSLQDHEGKTALAIAMENKSTESIEKFTNHLDSSESKGYESDAHPTNTPNGIKPQSPHIIR